MKRGRGRSGVGATPPRSHRFATLASLLGAMVLTVFAAAGPAGAASKPHHHVAPFLTQAGVPVTNLVANTPDPVTTSNPGLSGFAGLDAVASEQVNGFGTEPPDQGLCTDGTSVMEAVNVVWAVYSTQGNIVAGPQDINSFFGEDPRCSPAT